MYIDRWRDTISTTLNCQAEKCARDQAIIASINEEMIAMRASLAEIQTKIQANGKQGNKKSDHINILNNKILFVKLYVDKIAVEISEKVNQFEAWINDMKGSDSNMEIPQVIAESIQEIITNSAPGLAVSEIREEFEVFKGEIKSGRGMTEMLRDLVVNLKSQLDSNISLSSDQSINLEHTGNNNSNQESSNSSREREIVRKRIERLERQINQLVVTKIPMDKSDIALINRLKVVDIPSLNNAVGNIQKPYKVR